MLHIMLLINLCLYTDLGKGKITPNRLEGPEGVRGIALLFLDLGA
jgi:hypothetical protein